MDLNQFTQAMDEKGWFILQGAASKELVTRLKKELNELSIFLTIKSVIWWAVIFWFVCAPAVAVAGA